MNTNKNLTIQETFNLAVKNHREDKIDFAQELYNQVLKTDPNHTDANNNLGLIFKKLGENQKAIGYFEKAISIDPNYVIALNNLGIIFKELRENQKAIDYFEKAIAINPNFANALNNLGIIFQELRENQKAKDCYEKAIAINPNYVNALNNLGTIFQALGENQKAKGCYEKAIAINPNFANAHYNLGVIFKELGENQKAKGCYEKTISINPNFANAYRNLANLFYLIGEFQNAKECFEKAIQIKPGNVHVSNGLLKSLYEMDDKSILFNELDSITKEGKMNAVIGSIFSRAEVKYGVKKENPFCNDPLHFVLKTDLTEKYDFKNMIVNCVDNILKNNYLSKRTQTLITNGYQTAGNLFMNEDFNTEEIQRIIHAEIEKYRLKFKDSKEGFLNNWPTNYSLAGWLISMKKGGKLKAHIHDRGWLSGSIYVNVPPKLQTNSGNLVVCIDENGNKKSIDVVNGSLCLFPSSLLHYTIPFEADEERIVLAFDMIPN